MTQPLAQAVRAVPGQPSSIRVGTVVSTAPLTISIQNVVFTDVGVLTSVPLQVGNPVVVIGQSPVSGSDPASWLVMGTPSQFGLRIRSVLTDATTNLPNALTLLSGSQLTFTTTLPTTLVEMWIYADLEVIAANIATAVVRPFLDGVALGVETQVICENPVAATAGRWTLDGRALFTVTPGSHTVELQGQTAVGVANTFRAVAQTTGYLIHIHG